MLGTEQNLDPQMNVPSTQGTPSQIMLHDAGLIQNITSLEAEQKQKLLSTQTNHMQTTRYNMLGISDASLQKATLSEAKPQVPIISNHFLQNKNKFVVLNTFRSVPSSEAEPKVKLLQVQENEAQKAQTKAIIISNELIEKPQSSESASRVNLRPASASCTYTRPKKNKELAQKRKSLEIGGPQVKRLPTKINQMLKIQNESTVISNRSIENLISSEVKPQVPIQVNYEPQRTKNQSKVKPQVPQPPNQFTPPKYKNVVMSKTSIQKAKSSKIPQPTKQIPQPTKQIPQPTKQIPQPTKQIPQPTNQFRPTQNKNVTMSNSSIKQTSSAVKPKVPLQLNSKPQPSKNSAQNEAVVISKESIRKPTTSKMVPQILKPSLLKRELKENTDPKPAPKSFLKSNGVKIIHKDFDGHTKSTLLPEITILGKSKELQMTYSVTSLDTTSSFRSNNLNKMTLSNVFETLKMNNVSIFRRPK